MYLHIADCMINMHHVSLPQLKEYISKDLLAMIYAAGDQSEMMEESQEATLRREDMIHMYHTCNEALSLIRDVTSKTCMAPSYSLADKTHMTDKQTSLCLNFAAFHFSALLPRIQPLALKTSYFT